MGGYETSIDYQPAESTTGDVRRQLELARADLVPCQLLVVDALLRYARFFGDEFTLEYPTGSGTGGPSPRSARTSARRLISLFLVDENGRRPCFGWVEKFQTDPAWKDNILFNEYFHGDNGAGLGAIHQTGWTGSSPT